MIHARRRASVVVLAGLAGALPVHAQLAPTSGRLYRLSPASAITEGCWAPCACPITSALELRGRFRLAISAADPFERTYRVSEMFLAAPQLSRTYTGSGTYRIGGDFALSHQMQLELLMNGATIQRFDSGRVAVGSPAPAPRWPRIDIALSRNNLFCFDTELHLVAFPVADWNFSGEITVGDIFDFLGGYFSGAGDADGNGSTSVEDIFQFLADYFDPA